jgi:cyclic lactone autoinducer peptide
MKQIIKQFIANVMEKSSDVVMSTVCLSGFYQPETPEELK